jgi:hypothetical protein
MVRTQIQLTAEQARRLRAWARDEGVSLAEIVRRCVERTLASRPGDRDAGFARAAELIGSLIDPEGRTDLARDHDRYLAKAFEGTDLR